MRGNPTETGPKQPKKRTSTAKNSAMKKIMLSAIVTFGSFCLVHAVCEKKTPKSATNPCATQSLCSSGGVTSLGEGKYSCPSKYVVTDVHTECKDTEAAVQCSTAGVDQCYRSSTCNPNTTYDACLDGNPYGDWSSGSQKVEDTCS